MRQPLIRAAFPDLRTTIEHQIAEGDTVATRATLRGNHLGPVFGVAPTNQTLTWSVLLMDKITDGKIVLPPCDADWLGVLVKLGVIAAPGGEIARPSTFRRHSRQSGLLAAAARDCRRARNTSRPRSRTIRGVRRRTSLANSTAG